MTLARPAPLWDRIVGQAEAVGLLRRAIARDRVAHAYAFLGPPGVGRRLTALAFAQGLLCPAGGCGSCSACRRVVGRPPEYRVEHPDCHFIAPTPPVDNPKGAPAIRIDDVRALEHWAALTPHEGSWKVFVVDDADRMTSDAPHALLKTLEEPPARTVLVLILAQARALPPTVLSRCQRIRFRPLADADVAALLVARGADPAAARRRARLADGQIGRALKDELAELEARSEAALGLLRTPFVRQARLVDGAHLDRDRAKVAGYLEVYGRLCRDALCRQVGAGPDLLFEPDRPEAADLANRVSPAALVGALGAVKEAWLALEGNVSPRLCLERALAGLDALGLPPGRAA